MRAVVTLRLNGTRFYLSPALLPTDIQDRAKTYRDLSDAELSAARENSDDTWGELTGMWHAAYILADGSLSIPDVERGE